MGNVIDIADWKASLRDVEDRARARLALDLIGYTDVDLDNLPGFTEEEIDLIALRIRAYDG